MLEAEEAPLQIAARLATQAGKARPIAVTSLTGGKNNRTYRVALEDGGALALKSYFTDPRDPRDRLAAEWEFLTQAWARGVRAIPEPLAREEDTHCGLYGFVEGRKLSPDEVTADHVSEAANFILAVNVPPRRLSDRAASEACFSLAQHLATVDRRVERLTGLDPEAPHRAEAEHFIMARLRPAWIKARQKIERGGQALETELDDHQTIVSPSDFGFHNALCEDGRLTFLDFEYAGSDDPAKLVCDFFCQPETPAPQIYFSGFAEKIITGLGLSNEHLDRCALLLDAYRVKWACIMLNDFLPLGAARRRFANDSEYAARCANQLAKAQQKIAQLST